MTYKDDFKAMEERENAATEGPWEWRESGWPTPGQKEELTPEVIEYAGCGTHEISVSDDNASFIAHARTDQPRLRRFAEKLIESHRSGLKRPFLETLEEWLEHLWEESA